MSMSVTPTGYQAPGAFNGALWGMGDLIQGNFGGGGSSPTKPPSQPPQNGNSGVMDPKLFQRYYHAFFDPRLNPYIGKVYSGDNFTEDLFQYVLTSIRTVNVSKIPAQTYRDRAFMIADGNSVGILRYLERFVAMQLDSVDVRAITQIYLTEKFIIKAGRAVFEAREKYGLVMKDSDAVRIFMNRKKKTKKQLPAQGKRSEEEIAHAENCPHCKYMLDAAVQLEAEHGTEYPEYIEELITGVQEALRANMYFYPDLDRQLKDRGIARPINPDIIREFRDRVLPKTLEIWAVGLYLESLSQDFLIPGDACNTVKGMELYLGNED